jgi:signal peptidase I
MPGIKSKIGENLKTAKGYRKLAKEVSLFLVDILYNAVIIIILVILIRSYLISPFRVVGSSMADTLESNEFILIDKLSYILGEPDRGDPVVFRPPVTGSASPKFEEMVTTDENGAGVLSLKNLKTQKNVIYCQNKLIKSFWFCKDTAEDGDIAYYHSIGGSPDENADLTWKSASKAILTKEDIENNELKISGDPNKTYSIRIYSPNGPEYFVKRIIGIPGDTVKIENGEVYLQKAGEKDFVELSESYLNEGNKHKTFLNGLPDSGTFTVPDHKYFLMGDNRQKSNDSRSWFSPIDQLHTPFVSVDDLSGKVLVVLWPLRDIHFIPSGNL